MDRVGLHVADLAQPDKWIRAAAVARLLDTSARRSNCEDFGLRLAEFRRLSTLGPLSIVLREEPDLRSGVGAAHPLSTQLQRSAAHATSEANGVVTIQLWFEFGEPAPTRQAAELAVAALHGIIREFLGQEWHPLSVCFSHPPPSDLRPYRRLFGPRLQFDHEITGLLLYAGDLDAKNAMSDPLLRPYAQQLLASMAHPPGRKHRRSGPGTRRIPPTTRTMLDGRGRSKHRRGFADTAPPPRARHESFTSIVNATRAALAERYLTNDRYSMTDVSQMLGFCRTERIHPLVSSTVPKSVPREWRSAARQARESVD